MASPDVQKDPSLNVVPVQPQEDVLVGPQEPIPLRRSASKAHSIALNTKANGIPIEQAVSTWADQTWDPTLIDEFLGAPTHAAMSEREKESLRRQSARVIADSWITLLGYTGPTRDINDKIFYHRSLFQ